MYWSKYNFLITSNNKKKWFLYNSNSNYFAEIDEATFFELEKIKENNDFSQISYEQMQYLKEKRIIVNSDYNEFCKIKLKTHLDRFNNGKLSLTIAPTNDCNFSCNYCFEKNRLPIYMSEKTENNILNFIGNFKKIDFLSVTWYGGEPLLNFKSIKRLTKKIKDIGIPFSASIITNGYLLTKEKATIFEELKIKNIQITIDGTEQVHNKRRYCKNGDESYSTIIDNIKHLSEISYFQNTPIAIRVNIDGNNKSEFAILYNEFQNNKEFQKLKKLYLYPAFVDDINNDYVNEKTSCNDIQNCLMDKTLIIEFYKTLLLDHNINSFSFYPEMLRYECMARNINSYVFGADGAAYKCWNDIGNNDKEIFNINEPGLRNDAVLNTYLTGADPFDDVNCQECNLLPICSCGCVFNRIKNIITNKNDKTENICSIFKENIEDFLTNYHLLIKNYKNDTN